MRLVRLLLGLALLPACGSDTFTTSTTDGGPSEGGSAADGGSESGVADARGPDGCAGPGDLFGSVATALAADRGCSQDTNCANVFVQTACCTFRALGINHGFLGDGGADSVLSGARACLVCSGIACAQTIVQDEQGNPVTNCLTPTTPSMCFTPKCNSLGGGKNGCVAEPL